ncbi:MAG: SH3 domain-containing protein [Bacillota bacterium]
MKKTGSTANKRFLAYLPLMVAFGALAAYPRPALQAANPFQIGATVTVTAPSLNVRDAAGTTAKVLGSVPAGSTGKIIGGPNLASGSKWWKIDYLNGPDGWSAEPFLRVSSSLAPAVKFKAGDRIISTDTIIIRNGVGLSAKIVGVISQGSTGTIIAGPNRANDSNWWLINNDNGADGWTLENPLSKVSSTPTPIPKPTLKWGAYAGNNPGDLESFEKLVGKQADIQAVFVGWNDPFPWEIARRLKNSGKTLLIFWEPYSTSLESIDAGHSDGYMEAFATEAKAYGGPIMLAPLHEMNGNWDPWGGYGWDDKPINSPSLIISVWRRMHGFFKGADNVKFAWAVNNDSVPDIPANSINTYYPGDNYVDYVGVDGFNFGTPWQSFDEVFGNAIKSVSVHKKPIYLFSIGSTASPEKDNWIKEGLGNLIQHYPGVAGWVWFNQNGPDRNWTINSDPDSLAAFRSVIPLK